MFTPSYHPQPTLAKVAVCVAMLASIATGKPNPEHVLGDLDYLVSTRTKCENKECQRHPPPPHTRGGFSLR